MVSTRDNTRDTFGGNSKAGIASRIGVHPVINNRIQFRTAPYTGSSFVPAWKAGYMVSPIYPVNKSNQLSRIGGGIKYGMTQTPSDGVNLVERERMQLNVNAWNQVSGVPIRRIIPANSSNQPLTNVKGVTVQYNVMP
jgi:hypothetical protein